MRVGLILISAALLLTGCSTVRGIFGGAEDAIEANQTPREIGAPDSESAEAAASNGAAPNNGKNAKPVIAPSENIKKAAKRLPDNLAGDSANAAHLGEPIPPQ